MSDQQKPNEDQYCSAQKVIGVYLVIAGLNGHAILAFTGTEMQHYLLMLAAKAALLGATIGGGIGLILDKPWGYGAAVAAFALQLVRFKVAGLTYSSLSPVGIFLYADAEHTAGIAVSLVTEFDPSSGVPAPWWFGVNLLVALLIIHLLIATGPVIERHAAPAE